MTSSWMQAYTMGRGAEDATTPGANTVIQAVKTKTAQVMNIYFLPNLTSSQEMW